MSHHKSRFPRRVLWQQSLPTLPRSRRSCFGPTRASRPAPRISTTFNYDFTYGPFTLSVKVTGTNFIYSGSGNDPAGGTYSLIQVFSGATQIASVSFDSPVDFATYFTAGAVTALAGSDTMTGTASDGDFFIGHGGADSMNGGEGGDFYGFYNGDVVAGETINDTGASGTDAILVLGSAVDFRGATISGIELVSFDDVGTNLRITNTPKAIFNAGQLPANLVVNGHTGGADSLVVTKATNFSAAGWVFGNWEANDVISIVGTAGNNTITGSSQRDIITGSGGDDRLFGGSGVDTLTGGRGRDVLTGGADR